MIKSTALQHHIAKRQKQQFHSKEIKSSLEWNCLDIAADQLRYWANEKRRLNP